MPRRFKLASRGTKSDGAPRPHSSRSGTRGCNCDAASCLDHCRAVERQWPRVAAIAVKTAQIAGALVVDVLLSGCGFGGGLGGGGYIPPNVTAPSPQSPTPQRPKPQLLAVTISGSGVSPAVAAGPRAIVEFTNRDAQVHDIRSNAHPGHSECTELNLGAIQPGHTVSILTPFESGRTCAYHDENQPDDSRFQGSINIR